ncbi:MAG: hypothetical protein SCARUB_02002 [Candidatus Scalindua rubra]|uniref:Uncharacterized protein n=1 Tax=Candidatus Scalindua rubra TaxID=1872076 RepID=A0A1E3XB68_9BACT|nr:MAG: hypothetical protein SCARUB_02002 [Candidatus Scalindua rubra]
MTQRTVSDLILDSFAEKIKKDDLFKGVAEDVIDSISANRRKKADIVNSLKKVENEDSRTFSD